MPQTIDQKVQTKEDTKANFFTQIAKYTSIYLVSIIFIEILVVVTNLSYISFSSVVVHIAALVYLFKELVHNNAKYWTKVGAGLLLSLIGSLGYALYHTLIFPILFPNYYEEQRKIIENSGLTGDFLQTLIDGANPNSVALAAILTTVVAGFIYSLIISAIIKPSEELE